MRSEVRAWTTSTMSVAATTSRTDCSLIRATRGSSVREREPIGHPGDEPADLVLGIAAFDEVVEDPADRLVCPLVLAARVRPEVDALEHEGAEREHRPADLVALDDLACLLGALDQVVHERVDPRRATFTEQFELGARQLLGTQDPEADRVVDVVVDVRHPVDEPDDPSFERRRLLGPVCVRIPSRTSAVRLSASAIRSDCSLWRKPVPKRSRRQTSSCSSPAWPNGGCPVSWPSPIASVRSSFNLSARATTRAIPVVSSVCVIRVR